MSLMTFLSISFDTFGVGQNLMFLDLGWLSHLGKTEPNHSTYAPSALPLSLFILLKQGNRNGGREWEIEIAQALVSIGIQHQAQIQAQIQRETWVSSLFSFSISLSLQFAIFPKP